MVAESTGQRCVRLATGRLVRRDLAPFRGYLDLLVRSMMGGLPVITLALDAPSVARIRFAASPAQEMLQWLLRTVNGDPHPVYGRPGPEARSALAHPDAQMLAALILESAAANCVPNFLTPSPTPAAGSTVAADQLELVEATPVGIATEQVQGLYPHRRPPRVIREAIEQGTLAVQAALGLRAFWNATLAEDWSVIQGVVDRDIAQRSMLSSQVGMGGMLASLHPHLGWRGGQIRVDPSLRDVHFQAHDTDVVLVPTVFATDRVWTQFGDRADVWLGYPISGDQVTAASHAATAALLGSSRAAIVDLLTVRRTTQELAGLLGLSPSVVSHHLHILYRAGVIVRDRCGRSVYYRVAS